MRDSGILGTTVQGGVTAMLIAFFNDALVIMVPFFIAAGVLIFVDLFFGIEAATIRRKKDPAAPRVRTSTAIRKTVGKVAEYLCWIVLGATLSVTFQVVWIEVLAMGIVFGNELVSIVSNYFYCRGKAIRGLEDLFLRIIGKKLDISEEISDVKIVDLNDGND